MITATRSPAPHRALRPARHPISDILFATIRTSGRETEAFQSAGFVRAVRSAGRMVASIVEEAEAILRRLGARGEA